MRKTFSPTRVRTGLALVAGATLALAGTIAPAQAAPEWAPADSAKIHPGVQTYTNGGQCTANFVFTDADDNVYVGQSAHCSGTGEATDTNGCDAGTLPLGTKVTFNEGGNLASEGTQVGSGKLAYSSWNTMQAQGESKENVCAHNDFALVQVNAGDLDQVNPSVPFFGGPNGINTTGTKVGDRVYSYGNSSLRGGLSILSPKIGASLGDSASTNGWSHPLYTFTPGVPGDSGSAFLDQDGNAVGTLSTLALLPLPLSNNIGDLARELRYAQQHSGIDGLQLVEGTEKFDPIL